MTSTRPSSPLPPGHVAPVPPRQRKALVLFAALLIAGLLVGGRQSAAAGEGAAVPRRPATPAQPGGVFAAALPAVFGDYCAGYTRDEFDDPTSGWPQFDDGQAAGRYLTPEYALRLRPANLWYGVTRGDVWDRGQRLQFKARVQSGDGYWGFVYGLNDDWTDFYTFELYGRRDGPSSYFVHHYTNGQWQLVDRYDYFQPLDLRAFHVMTLEYYGHLSEPIVVVELDEAGIYQIDVPPGRVGLSLGSLSSDFEVRYAEYVFSGRNCPLPEWRAAAQQISPPIFRPAPDNPGGRNVAPPASP